MRAEIQAATGCTASAGIGPNMLLARLATKRAKPNGQFCVTAAQARSFLAVSNWGSKCLIVWQRGYTGYWRTRGHA